MRLREQGFSVVPPQWAGGPQGQQKLREATAPSSPQVPLTGKMQLFKMTEWLMYYIYVTFNYNLLWLIM